MNWCKYLNMPDRLAGIHDLADIYIRNGNIFETLKVFQALFETTAEYIGWIDDSDGCYGDEFCRALEVYLIDKGYIFMDFQSCE